MRDIIKKKMAETIDKYSMLSGKNIPVAFSGGKDSMTCIILISDLGFNVKPVVIDRADDNLFNSDKIIQNLREFGYSGNVINLRDPEYLSILPQTLARLISGFLKEIDHIENSNLACTPCYNARTLALSNFSRQIGAKEYVLGMHKTDILTSFIRFYWIEKYFFAFTKLKGLQYNTKQMKDFIQNEEIDLEYLFMMVNDRRASTDDPPVEILSDGTRIVRPLVEVNEKDIFSFIKEIGYPHVSTNCKFRQNQDATPLRLIVQWDLVRRIEDDPNLEKKLFELAKESIRENGTLKFRPRNNIHKNYPGFDPKIRPKL